MSGGYFDYIQHQMTDVVERIDSLILSNDDQTTDLFGDLVGRGYCIGTIQQFKAAAEALTMASIYLQRVDWLLSGDDDEVSFLSRLHEDIRNHSGESLDDSHPRCGE